MTTETTAKTTVQVGDIYRTSWGYDQTNVEFFEVVRVTGASAVLRRTAHTVSDNRRIYPLPGRYTTDYLLMGNPGTPTRIRDEARGYSEKMCRKQRGYKGDTYFKISQVRYAYKYEGGGAFDTIAAGYPGH